jgi:WD40 repeat protein
MDNTTESTEEMSTILYSSFNQTNSHFALGTTNGYQIFQCEPFKRASKEDLGGIAIIELLFHTNIIGLVGGGDTPAFDPQTVVIFDVKNKKEYGKIVCNKPVKGLKLHRNLIFVIFEEQIHIFNDEYGIVKKFETWKNPNGCIALSPVTDDIIFAFPSSSTQGNINIQFFSQNTTKYIRAHNNAIGFLAISKNGKQVCTTSEGGTVLRVYNCETEEKLKEFRRGMTQTQITSVSFSNDGEFLCSASHTGTIHVFSLTDGTKRTSMYSYLNYVPFVNVEDPNTQTSIAEYKITGEGTIICRFSADSKKIHVVTSAGFFHSLEFDQFKGTITLENKTNIFE